MYAIVDIETTGGSAKANSITEVAIIHYDGIKETGRYCSLVKPEHSIPYHIETLTGISNDMVRNAPSFAELAPEIFAMLVGKVFVAHNVNFDYSFLCFQLRHCGFDLETKKLCTVRLSRKIFPGLPSYGLGNLCRAFDIQNQARHRAMGDALATTTLFERLLLSDKGGIIARDLAGPRKSEYQLPSHLPLAELDELPSSPGVYYFKDSKGKVIYVGKAVDIRKRVLSHFTGNSNTAQRQAFLREICHVDHQCCGTELMSLILEASEIKKYWPPYNRAMKRFEQSYGLYAYEDQRGLLRLMVDKLKKGGKAHFMFNNLADGRNSLVNLVRKKNLCPSLCFLTKSDHGCEDSSCYGVCRGEESVDDYNARVRLVLSELNSELPSFILRDSGRTPDEEGVILVERGVFFGMGYIKMNSMLDEASSIKEQLQPYMSNDYIRNLIISYSEQYPHKVIRL